jgi:hypothetical protein
MVGISDSCIQLDQIISILCKYSGAFLDPFQGIIPRNRHVVISVERG